MIKNFDAQKYKTLWFKGQFFLNSTLVEANFAKFLTDLFEQMHLPPEIKLKVLKTKVIKPKPIYLNPFFPAVSLLNAQ